MHSCDGASIVNESGLPDVPHCTNKFDDIIMALAVTTGRFRDVAVGHPLAYVISERLGLAQMRT